MEAVYLSAHRDWAKRSTPNQVIYIKQLCITCTNTISIEIDFYL